MCKSFILGFVAFLGCVSSIFGVCQLVIVVLYYAELPPIFMVLSLVTGTFVLTLSNCIVCSIISMIRSSIHLTGKIGVIIALCSMCLVTILGLLLLLLQCHWILDQNAFKEIGPFQLQCLKSVTDISEGIFLLIMSNAVILGLSLMALLPTCYWEVTNPTDVLQISFLSSNWVYEDSSENSNNLSETNMTLREDSFKQSRRFGNTNMQIPKVHFKSIRRTSITSSSQLLKNMSSFSINCSEQPHGAFAEVLAAMPHTPHKPSENTLVRMTSFCPSDVKENCENEYKQSYSPPVRNLNESDYTENNRSTLKSSAPFNYVTARVMNSNSRPPSNADDISHWLKKGKWRKEGAHQTPGARMRSPSLPGPATPSSWINELAKKRSSSNIQLTKNIVSTDQVVTPKKYDNNNNPPKIIITPPNEKYHFDIKAAINSLDNVLHLTPSVSTASYRNSDSPYSEGSSPM